MQVRALITPVNDLATRCKSEREAKGWSQSELADRSGVSQGTIGNIESGIRKNPRELIAIAAALGVQPLWFKSGKGPKHPSNGGASENHEKLPIADQFETGHAPPPNSKVVRVVAMINFREDGKIDSPIDVQNEHVSAHGASDRAYALRIVGGGPGLLQHGYVLVLDPAREPVARTPILLVTKNNGAKQLRVLQSLDAEVITTTGIDGGPAETVLLRDVEVMHRVINIIPGG